MHCQPASGTISENLTSPAPDRRAGSLSVDTGAALCSIRHHGVPKLAAVAAGEGLWKLMSSHINIVSDFLCIISYVIIGFSYNFSFTNIQYYY